MFYANILLIMTNALCGNFFRIGAAKPGVTSCAGLRLDSLFDACRILEPFS